MGIYDMLLAKAVMKDNGGGGGNDDLFIVNFSANTDDLSTFTNATCDKTYLEIYSAYDNGKNIVAFVTVSYINALAITSVLSQIVVTSPTDPINFNSLIEQAGNGRWTVFVSQVTIENNNNVIVGLTPIYQTS